MIPDPVGLWELFSLQLSGKLFSFRSCLMSILVEFHLLLVKHSGFPFGNHHPVGKELTFWFKGCVIPSLRKWVYPIPLAERWIQSWIPNSSWTVKIILGIFCEIIEDKTLSFCCYTGLKECRYRIGRDILLPWEEKPSWDWTRAKQTMH